MRGPRVQRRKRPGRRRIAQRRQTAGRVSRELFNVPAHRFDEEQLGKTRENLLRTRPARGVFARGVAKGTFRPLCTGPATHVGHQHRWQRGQERMFACRRCQKPANEVMFDLPTSAEINAGKPKTYK